MPESSLQLNQKTTRLNIRTNARQKELITKAAQIKHTTVSDFVLENACEAAHEILAQRNYFNLSDEKWTAFCDALDAPPKDIDSLKKLLLEPGVFDDQ